MCGTTDNTALLCLPVHLNLYMPILYPEHFDLVRPLHLPSPNSILCPLYMLLVVKEGGKVEGGGSCCDRQAACMAGRMCVCFTYLGDSFLFTYTVSFSPPDRTPQPVAVSPLFSSSWRRRKEELWVVEAGGRGKGVTVAVGWGWLSPACLS